MDTRSRAEYCRQRSSTSPPKGRPEAGRLKISETYLFDPRSRTNRCFTGLVTDGTVHILTYRNDGRAEAGVKDAPYRINALHPSAAWHIQNVEAARVRFLQITQAQPLVNVGRPDVILAALSAWRLPL
jgi:hypothetical protein